MRLFHCHQGSQLPNIRAIREAAGEAVRVYLSLVEEGAPMGLLDLGGGLAVDYDGSHTNSPSSCNYGLEEYAGDLVEIVREGCDQAGISHPDLITESGRAVVAPYSVLVFDILDEARFSHPHPPDRPGPEAHETVGNLWDITERIGTADPQECYNDALFYRDQVRALFNHGQASLRDRALAERLFWHIITRLADEIRGLAYVPEELQQAQRPTHRFLLRELFGLPRAFPIIGRSITSFPSCLCTATGKSRAAAPFWRTSPAIRMARWIAS